MFSGINLWWQIHLAIAISSSSSSSISTMNQHYL
jgi:hypothetical protein